MKNCLLYILRSASQNSLCAVLLLFSLSVDAQVDYEIIYPEKELLASLQEAKTPEEQVRAAGFLALHYKWNLKDSLSAVYMNHVHRTANASGDIGINASALWWEAFALAKGTLYAEYEKALVHTNGEKQP
jgi:hypothetical protein